MTTKRIAMWGLLLVGAGIAAAGFIMTPDFFKANLPASEVAKLADDAIATIKLLQVALIACGILLMALSMMLYRFGRQVLQAIMNILQLDSQLLESTPNKQAALNLFLVSFLGLFFETLIIRWLSTEVRLFAYYKNLSLIAAFMGLGIGFMLARKRSFLFPIFPIAFCALSAVILLGVAKGVFLSLSNPAGSDVWIWGILQRSALPSLLSFFALIPFFFLSTVLVFIPLGQATGQSMQPFPPIRAYTINILGSLVGVWGFSALSFLNWPPFACGFCAGLDGPCSLIRLSWSCLWSWLLPCVEIPTGPHTIALM